MRQTLVSGPQELGVRLGDWPQPRGRGRAAVARHDRGPTAAPRRVGPHHRHRSTAIGRPLISKKVCAASRCCPTTPTTHSWPTADDALRDRAAAGT